MGNCANLTDSNIEKGSYCFNGEPRGFGYVLSPLTVDNSSLKTKAWWDAQIYDSSNRVSLVYGANYVEENPGEVQEEAPEYGSKIQTSKMSNEIILKYQASECLRKHFDVLNGQEVYTVLFLDSDFIQGIPNGYSQMKFVKTQISVFYETVNKVKYVNVKLTYPDNDYETEHADLAMETGFKINDVTGLTSVFMDFVSGDTTTDIIFDAYDCSRTGIESGLTVSNVEVYNLTDDPTEATPIVPSLITNSGNRWTATIAVQDTGDNVKVVIKTPSATNLYVTGSPATGQLS
jgi:hypothetical protein